MQCSRNKCTKALYRSKMTPSVLFSISFLMIPNIFLALLTATEHWADYFRKLTDHFPEMRLPILSSASHRHSLGYFCYMCYLTFIYAVARLPIFCFCVPFCEILLTFLTICLAFDYLEQLTQLQTWWLHCVLPCPGLFYKAIE